MAELYLRDLRTSGMYLTHGLPFHHDNRAAPGSIVTSLRESHRAENMAALVTCFVYVAPMLFQQRIAMLDGEPHQSKPRA